MPCTLHDDERQPGCRIIARTTHTWQIPCHAMGKTLADEVADEPAAVTEPGGWGPWVDGGGWLTIGGRRVPIRRARSPPRARRTPRWRGSADRKSVV